MTNLDSILKSRDIALSTKVCLVKAMIFPVVMYGCESWTIKKAERQRINAFELWCWRRLLRVPWTARRSNQSIPKETSPGCSLEGLMLTLKLQSFGLLMWRADSFEKTLILGGFGGRRRRGRQRMKWLDGITDSVDMGLVDSRSWWWTGRPGVLQSMGSQRVGHDWVTELNWKGSLLVQPFPAPRKPWPKSLPTDWLAWGDCDAPINGQSGWVGPGELFSLSIFKKERLEIRILIWNLPQLRDKNPFTSPGKTPMVPEAASLQTLSEHLAEETWGDPLRLGWGVRGWGVDQSGVSEAQRTLTDELRRTKSFTTSSRSQSEHVMERGCNWKMMNLGAESWDLALAPSDIAVWPWASPLPSLRLCDVSEEALSTLLAF